MQIGDSKTFPTYGGNSTLINNNFNDTNIEGQEVGNEVVIAHEFGHSYRDNEGLNMEYDGDLQAKTLKGVQDVLLYKGRLQQASEAQASHIENMVREELGISPRKHYSNVEIYSRPPFSKNIELKYIDVKTIKPGFNYSKKRIKIDIHTELRKVFYK